MITLQIPIKGNNNEKFRREVKGEIKDVIEIKSGTKSDMSDEIIMFIVECNEEDKQFNTDLGFGLFKKEK